MQYALLIYSQPDALATPGEPEWAELNKEYWAIREVPGVSTGAGLQPVETATTVRLQDGKTLVTDGPFADTKEVLAGFYLYEADNLDQATELAARIPAVRLGGSVEIRPVMVY
ncbi:MAG TPA: YciI family protein [Streptosporangiaceae bacterium]|nr:YciI family protein [Streptosporangiaceae bacterium]